MLTNNTETDLIVGAIDGYGWDTIKYWCNSIKMSGFTGKKVMIVFNCNAETVQKLVDENFIVVGTQSDGEGGFNYSFCQRLTVHCERFFHIWHFLEEIGKTNKIRNVITTDVKDVVFQKNPQEFMEKYDSFSYDLYISNEGLKYENEPWGMNNYRNTFGPFFWEYMKDKMIYNVGVIAGSYEKVKNLALLIFQMSLNRPIPIVDQAVFNFLIHHKAIDHSPLYRANHNDDFACQLGTTRDPTKIEGFIKHLDIDCLPRLKKDVVVNPSDLPYYICHQYDRVPEFKIALEKKYGD